MNIKNIKFTTFLSIVSIIGFVAILINSVFGTDVNNWADALLFMIIGFALFVIGGAKFFAYLKDGLTSQEVVRMIYSLIGGISFFTGVIMLPLFGFNIIVLDIVKAIIALIAILVIFIEQFVNKN